MSSRQIGEREAECRSAIPTIREFADTVGDNIHPFMKQVTKRGEDVPSFPLLLELVARYLDRSLVEMIEADRANETELGDDSTVRQRRDDARDAVRTKVVALRGTVQSLFGDVGLKSLRIWDACPADPKRVEQYARDFAANLRSSKIELPAPATDAVRFDREKSADELDALTPSLTEALKQVAAQESASLRTTKAKAAAMAKFDRDYRLVTNFAAAAFQLAGLDEQAERIRPTQRKANSEAPAAGGGGGGGEGGENGQ